MFLSIISKFLYSITLFLLSEIGYKVATGQKLNQMLIKWLVNMEELGSSDDVN